MAAAKKVVTDMAWSRLMPLKLLEFLEPPKLLELLELLYLLELLKQAGATGAVVACSRPSCLRCLVMAVVAEDLCLAVGLDARAPSRVNGGQVPGYGGEGRGLGRD
jgi:hypothetical protein